MKKYFLIVATILLLSGCGEANFKSNENGKEVVGVEQVRMKQVCVDGVLYLFNSYYFAPQLSLEGSLIKCSKKDDVHLTNGELEKLIENKIKKVSTEIDKLEEKIDYNVTKSMK